MPPRSEILAALLTIVPLVIVLPIKRIDPLFVSSNMAILFLVGSLPLYVYAAYWAFDTRRALAVRVYRNQALSTGILTLVLWFSFYAFVTFSNSSNLQLADGVTAIAFSSVLLAFFYFTDVTMRAARRSDPLLRDTLYWSKLRIPLWIIVGFSFGAILGITFYAIATNDLNLLTGINTGAFENFLLNLVFNYFTYIPFVGIIFLPAVAIRAKWDRGLRLYFLWVALVILTYFINTEFNIPGTFILLFLAGGYFLYRASRSLAPISQAPKLESPNPPTLPSD